MSVIRVKHQKNYVVILNNTVLTDPDLSFKAKGLWAYCMSRKEDWEFHVNQLAEVSTDGKDAIYSAINELVEAGYIKKIQYREKGKFISYDYEVSEIKIILPQREKPDTDEPVAENPPLLSIDELPVSIDIKQSLPLTPSIDEEIRRERANASSHTLEKKMQAIEKSMEALEVQLEDSQGQMIQIGQSTKEMLSRNHSLEEIEGALNYLCNCYYDKGRCPDKPIAVIQKALREGLKGLSDSEKECVAYIELFKNKHREINLIIYETYVKEPDTQRDMVFTGMSFNQFKERFHQIWRF